MEATYHKPLRVGKRIKYIPPEDVATIKGLLAYPQVSCEKVARFYKFSRQAIQDIRSGKSHKDIEPELVSEFETELFIADKIRVSRQLTQLIKAVLKLNPNIHQTNLAKHLQISTQVVYNIKTQKTGRWVPAADITPEIEDLARRYDRRKGEVSIGSGKTAIQAKIRHHKACASAGEGTPDEAISENGPRWGGR